MAFNSSTISVGSTTKKSHFDQLLDNTIALGLGYATMPAKTFYSATTFVGSSTFNSTVRASSIISRTSTAGIGIGTGQLGRSSTASVAIMRCKILDLPAWDMTANPTLQFDHGLDHTKIRTVSVTIYVDGKATKYDFAGTFNYDSGGTGIHRIDWTVGELRLDRMTGGFFDGALFNDTSTSRGYAIIWYVE